jgi:hypothetical protein
LKTNVRINGNIVKNRFFKLVACGAMVCAWSGPVLATQTALALCNGGPLTIHSGLTAQVVDSTFGTNLETLAFTGTTTYDFYSPRLISSVSLVRSDKGGGVIYMSNTGATSSNDFSVTGDMQFFDYDPASGTETLIVDTTASSPQDVNHGQTVNWAVPNALLLADTTIPAGHMIHLALTITLVSGQPGNFGQVLYNGPAGSSTFGLLPQNPGHKEGLDSVGGLRTPGDHSTVFNWTFDAPAVPRPLSIFPQSNGQMVLGCYGSAQTSYCIQVTTNLTSSAWVILVTTNTDANGLLNFTDQDAAHCPCRFYRRVTP